MENETLENDLSASPALTNLEIVFLFLAGLLAIGSLLNVGYGIHITYTYNDASKVVGGDAYNFIIIGLRGLAWICTGIVSAILAILCFLAGKR